MEKVIYTAIIGNYEELKEPDFITPGWKYVCFTDQPFKSNTWEIRPIEPGPQPQRKAREIKILFHNYVQADQIIWADGSFRIYANLDTFWNKHFNLDFSAPSHPLRQCVYQEAQICIKNKRGPEEEITPQIQHYAKIGIPPRNGLIGSGILLRKASPECISLCEDWHEEVKQWSTRDQLAFANISRGRKYSTFFWNYMKNTDFKYIKHYNRR